MNGAPDSAAAPRSGDSHGVPGPGEIIAGKFRIEDKLGKGGMGVVFAARHLQLNQRVAIKFLHAASDPRGTVKARFMREARAAASLQSEHVARVYDVGAMDDGSPYIVMEYLAGLSLSQVIRRRAPLPIGEACDFMVQACRAMTEAHSLGIVHRDIKPGNMFIVNRPDGSQFLKILDFGISKIAKLDDEEEHTLTQSHVLLGSPKYLSPEQVRDAKHVDHRSDVWALGLVLYYMLTGKRPFEGETMSAVCVSIATDTPFRVRALRPEVPVEIDQVVMQCLEKDREFRVQTAADLAAAIAPFAAPSNAAAASTGGGLVVAGLGPPSATGVGVSAATGSMPMIGPVGPISSSADVIEMSGPGVTHLEPMRPPQDSRNMALAVSTKKPAVPVLWLQVGAGLAVVSALIFILVGRSKSETSPQQSRVVSVAKKSATPGSKQSSAPKVAAHVPAKRTVLVPGTGRVKARVVPDKDLKDYSHLLGSGEWGTAQATLRLMNRPGNGQVIGVVPKGEVVTIQRVKGEWALVSYLSAKKKFAGWTLRNLVE